MNEMNEVNFFYFYWVGSGRDARYMKIQQDTPWHVWINSEKRMGLEKISEMKDLAEKKGKAKVDVDKGWICAIKEGVMWDDGKWAEVTVPHEKCPDPGMDWNVSGSSEE